MGHKCSICGKEFDPIEKLIKDLEIHQSKENLAQAKEKKRKEDLTVIQSKIDELTILMDNYNLKYNKDGYGIGYTTEYTNPKTFTKEIINENKIKAEHRGKSNLEKFLYDAIEKTDFNENEDFATYADNVFKNLDTSKMTTSEKYSVDIAKMLNNWLKKN